MSRRDLIGEPADDSPEFVVLNVERRGWFTWEALIQARRSFTWSGFPPRQMARMLARWIEPEISIAAGETFRLLLPRRLAEQGRLIGFEEIAENPAFQDRWTGTPLG